MKMLFSALALAALAAVPASAQSYDPSLGSGNIAPSAMSSGIHQGQVAPGAFDFKAAGNDQHIDSALKRELTQAY
jgi:hypothetical protein